MKVGCRTLWLSRARIFSWVCASYRCRRRERRGSQKISSAVLVCWLHDDRLLIAVMAIGIALRRFPMRVRLEIPSRVLKNAAKYGIPDRGVSQIARRDRSCVYCKLKFRFGTRSRRNLASWEHMDGHSVRHPKVWNIALCCGSCNASRGPKGLAEWFDSAYCKRKNISRRTVAPVIRRYLAKGF